MAKWLSVLEGLPMPYSPCLLYIPGYLYPEIVVGYLTDVGECGWQLFHQRADCLRGSVVTHWQPLPRSPGEPG